jgi:hypothetical protein
MALGDPYAIPADLELRLGQTDDGSFTRLLDAASRAVESFTRRQFTQPDPATPRRFRALDYERVAVDDFFTLDDLEVEVAGVAWDVDTYIDARPWDGILAGQIAWPYSDLFAINRMWPWARRAGITVTAQWGWLAVPSGIIEATLDNAEMMYLTRYAAQAAATRSITLGGYTESFGLPVRSSDVPPEMLKALPFRRRNVFGVA